jgi:hypothetical protein
MTLAALRHRIGDYDFFTVFDIWLWQKTTPASFDAG